MWFSHTWWLYIRTSFGWWALYALALWVAAVPVIAALPRIRRRKTFVVCVAGACFVVLWVVTFRLELSWGGRSLSEWVWCLRSRDPELRRQAANGLAIQSFKFGVPEGTVPIAQRALHDEVPEVRRFAASFFARYPCVEVIPDLTEVLSDPDAQVRTDAVRALAKLGPSAASALPQIQLLLNDPVPAVRANAAGAYITAGGDRTLGLSTLERSVRETNQEDRICAAHVLVLVADRADGAFPLLTALLGDKDQNVRFYTTLAIYDLGPHAKPLIPALLVNLKDGDHYVRGTAAWALGQIKSPENDVVAAVVPLLKDPDMGVRRDAAYALGYMGAVQAIPALKAALHDPDPNVSTGAREALDRLERR